MVRWRRSFGLGLALGLVGAVLLLLALVWTAGVGPGQVAQMVRVVSLMQNQALNQVDNQEMFQGALAGMVGALDDPYSVYLSPKEYKSLEQHISGNYGGVGLLIGKDEEKRLVVISPFKGTPAFKAGIKSGDRITGIDGEDTADMDLDAAAARMQGEPKTEVVLTIAREGAETKEYPLVREVIEIPSVAGSFLPDTDGIVYLNMTMFNQHTGEELGKELARLEQEGAIKGVVLDLRNNPGGYLPAAVEVASYFVPRGPVVQIVDRSGTQTLEAGGEALGLPLAVLVNKGSASASEIVAGAIKDTKSGTVVGATTFGKGLVQTVFEVGQNAAVKLTTAKYLTPAKNDINKKGIEPDIKVELDPKIENEILARAPDLTRDTQLQKALAVVLAKKK